MSRRAAVDQEILMKQSYILRTHIRGNHGFTLVELLGTIGIIGVVVGLLLPAVQKIRETVNDGATARGLAAIATAENTCHSRFNTYTSSFNELVNCGLAGVWPVNNGHSFAITSTLTTFQAVATPITPASFNSCMITQSHRASCTLVPGGNEMRGLMFLRIAAVGATTVAGDLSNYAAAVDWGTGVPADTIRNYLAQASTVSQMFEGLDSDHNGTVTLSELFTPASGGINNLLPAVQNIFAPGTGGENMGAIGVKQSQLPEHLCSNDDGQCPIFAEPPQ